MSILMKSRGAALAYIALSTAAVVGGTCAADEGTRGQMAASVRAPLQTANASSPDGRPCAGHEVLVGPDGHKFRSAYIPGYGCRYIVDGNPEVLAVGPNGYAFEWTYESGWKLFKAVD
jgi:hypothetical protein